MLPATSSLQEAAAWLLATRAREVVVLDDSQRVCGVVSDCEVAIGTISSGRHPGEVTLAELLGARGSVR